MVAADYRGLGAPGLHPYLVGTSEGEDVLDGARAARSLVGQRPPNAVVVLGYSQGGQAALFAGEIAQTYAPELFVAGVAAVAPVTSVLELAPTGDRPPPSGQSAFTAMALFAWARHYRTFGLQTVLTPAGLAGISAVSTSCVDGVASLYDAVAPSRFFLPVGSRSRPSRRPTGPTARAVRRRRPRSWWSRARPTRWSPSDGPRASSARSCAGSQYDTVDYVAEQGVGHSQVLDLSTHGDRPVDPGPVRGGTAVDSCTRPGLGIGRLG